MTLTLSDLDAVDQGCVEAIGAVPNLHHGMKVELPSGIRLTAVEILEMVCGHDKWRQITHDLEECTWCGRVEPV